MTPELARQKSIERQMACVADSVVAAFAEQHATAQIPNIYLEPGVTSFDVRLRGRFAPGYAAKRRRALDRLARRFGGCQVQTTPQGLLIGLPWTPSLPADSI
jgi:hypothetical protein